MNRFLAIALGLGCALTFTTPKAASAQQSWPVFVEANLAPGAAFSSGEYADKNVAVMADLLVGAKLRSTARGAIVVAASFGIQSPAIGPVNDICQLAPDGGCMDRFPQFTAAFLLGGWETQDTKWRVLSGPAAVRVHGDWENIRLGFLGRLDGTAPLWGRVSFVGSLKGFVVPSYDGDTFLFTTLGLGLRLR